jgi:hypothetical protein
VDYKDRFRTPHGSHTVAAEGGCSAKSCALWWNDIQFYQKNGELKDKTKGEKLLIALFEAVEDMYLLSYSDNLICQMSSHYSTLASLLIWARTGARDPYIIIFLDLKAVIKVSIICLLMIYLLVCTTVFMWRIYFVTTFVVIYFYSFLVYINFK